MSAFETLAARLIASARRLGEARATERRLQAADPAARWHQASLLWPLFTKG